jgi:oxepin-CoA hydrolase/3-oxo-5,6-dehydrosuberyl-CoA semialdehyde dehydrogenase
VDIVIHAHILPEGALQSLLGGTGDLLDHLGPEDVVAFTGSAETARLLSGRESVRAANPRFNTEADSLNAAVLLPGASQGAVFDLFVRDVVREITQKTGQKCTAVRRILAPAELADRALEALVAALGSVVTGNPAEPGVTMGPLATREQLESAVAGASLLASQARVVVGGTARVDGVGSPEGQGYFFAPTLLRAEDAGSAPAAHEREVFGPVATLIPYDGSAAEAARVVGLGGGMLVTSLYGDDQGWMRTFVAEGATSAGRIYIGSSATADDAPGSGAAFPQALHGGPGRAGGGAELGGLVGARLYMQRVALQGSPELLGRLIGGEAEPAGEGGDRADRAGESGGAEAAPPTSA